MSRTYIWPVTGMHCVSCERVIADELKKIPGADEYEVSLKKRKVGIRLADHAPEPDLDALNGKLRKHGYWIGERSKNGPTCELPGAPLPLSKRLWEAIGMVILVGVGFSFVYWPFSRLVPSVTAQASIVAMFIFGVVASVSTCLASTGAFLLAFTSSGKSRANIVTLHVSRLAAFALGGAVLGAVGFSIPSQGGWYGWLALALGFGFVVVGLHLLSLSPSWGPIGFRLPKKLFSFADAVAKLPSSAASLAVGAVTFFLPCGFTQTAQALVLSSGSVVRGSMMMLAFALGTAPVLFFLTWFGKSVNVRQRWIRLATGAALLVFAVGQIDGGLTVLGSSITVRGVLSQALGGVRETVDIPPVNAQEQVVNMTVAYGAFTPDLLTVKRGVPVRWEINGVDVFGCASTIVAPKIRVFQTLRPGMNVIRFTPLKAGMIPFSCSMGMIRGMFRVVN